MLPFQNPEPSIRIRIRIRCVSVSRKSPNLSVVSSFSAAYVVHTEN